MKRLIYIVFTVSIAFLGCNGGTVFQVETRSDKTMVGGIENQRFANIESLLFSDNIREISISSISQVMSQKQSSYFEYSQNHRTDFSSTQAFLYIDDEDDLTQIILIAHNDSPIDLNEIQTLPDEYFYISYYIWNWNNFLSIGYVNSEIRIYTTLEDRLNSTSSSIYSYYFKNMKGTKLVKENDDEGVEVIISGYISNQ